MGEMMEILRSLMEFNKACINWLKAQEHFVKESTYNNYSFLINRHIVGSFNLIADVDSTSLNQFIVIKKTEGRLDKLGGLGIKTINQLVTIIKMICNHFGNINIKTHKISQQRDNQYDIFTKKELTKIKVYLLRNQSYINNGILIAIYSGIRIGELAALTTDDIKDEQIYITKTLQRIYCVNNKTKVIITSPKSVKANRKIPMHLKLTVLAKDGYIMTGNQKYLEPRVIAYHFKKILKILEIKTRPFHYIRHTFATNLIDNTSDIKTVSALLGHSSVATTLDIYAHSSELKKKNCINSL